MVFVSPAPDCSIRISICLVNLSVLVCVRRNGEWRFMNLDFAE